MRAVILVVCFMPMALLGQSYDLMNWKAYPVPISKDSIESYSSDANHWFVYMKNGKIFAANDIEEISDTGSETLSFPDSLLKKVVRMFPEGKRSVWKVDDGFLIGVYNGVYRAGLFWFSLDGKKGYQISSQKIVKIIQRGDRIYAIQNFPNLEVAKGNIIKLVKVNSNWVTRDYLELTGSPLDIAINDLSDLIVLTVSQNNLIFVNERGEAKDINLGYFFNNMYPNNVLSKGDELYIGMNKGILKVDLKSNSQIWLLPN